MKSSSDMLMSINNKMKISDHLNGTIVGCGTAKTVLEEFNHSNRSPTLRIKAYFVFIRY